MKKVYLVMVVSAVLVTLGFAQTPAAGSNTDQANVKGCLAGSEGNYTVAEDGTGQIFKITTSSVDLKPHLGHDVNLMGHKASGAISSGAADNSIAVTELSMISEHCAAAAVAPAATVSPSSAPVSTPPVDATAPAATASPSSAPVSTPAVDAAVAPAATVSPSSAPVSTPPVDATAPAATVNPSSAPVSTPAVDAAVAPSATVSPSSEPVTPTAEAAPPPPPSAHARKRSAKQVAAATEPAATASPSAETVTPPAAEAATPVVATASPSPEPVSPPVAAATAPAATRRGGLLWLLILFAVLVIALGTLVPLLSKWRKRKALERTGAPNLSFTNETTSDQDKPKPRKVA